MQGTYFEGNWDLFYSGMIVHTDIEITVMKEEVFILTVP